MNQRTVLIIVLVAAILRFFIPYVDLFLLVMLFLITNHPEEEESLVKLFLVASFVSSFITSDFIGILPLVMALVLFVGTFIRPSKTPKGVPTTIFWVVSIAFIGLLENLLIMYFSTGQLAVSAIALTTLSVTVGLVLLSKLYVYLPKIR